MLLHSQEHEAQADWYTLLEQANFYAQFIYLHRVAFKTYPSTADVTYAIARIIELATYIADANKISRHDGEPSLLAGPASQKAASHTSTMAFRTPDTEKSNGGSQNHEPERGLPATMLWPLFLAAIEGTPSDRQVLLQMMREMDTRRVTNAARTLFLLEEVLRRQDREGRRVDHRSVRRDLFEGELSVLY